MNSTNTTQQLEKTLWDAANKLRGNINSSDYKYVVLGRIFIKYVSDAFETQFAKYKAEGFDETDEDFLRDYLTKDNIFYVPPTARWKYLQDHAKQPQIGELVDKAMAAIEKENKSLKGVLPTNYGREELDKTRLGELIDLFTNKIRFGADSKDLLGRVYEYFIGMFADSEGKHGGEFYTPRSIVRLLVAMIQPFKGRVYDPCCGSGGMFVSSEDFVKEHQGRIGDIAVYGQELNTTTWRLAKMNMAIRGIDARLEQGDTLQDDKLRDLKFDFILANPPFNISDWGQGRVQDDVRWQYGLPPAGNANYAWIQHIIHHLSPRGVSGFVMANGTMTSNTSGEGDIRRRIVEAGLVDCIIACPDKLFFNVTLPCCLWFVSRSRTNRKDKTLFIDARKLGFMESRKTRKLSEDDIKKITAKYHAFLEKGDTACEPGFAKVAALGEIKRNDFALTPGLYVGSEVVEDDSDLDEQIAQLKTELLAGFAKGRKLEEKIIKNLENL